MELGHSVGLSGDHHVLERIAQLLEHVPSVHQFAPVCTEKSNDSKAFLDEISARQSPTANQAWSPSRHPARLAAPLPFARPRTAGSAGPRNHRPVAGCGDGTVAMAGAATRGRPTGSAAWRDRVCRAL